MKKNIVFDVFVDTKTTPQFFTITVWPSKKAMNNDRWKGRKKETSCEAYWSPNNSEFVNNKCDCGKKHTKNMPLLGTIHFHKELLSYGIISHEMFHAIMSGSGTVWKSRSSAGFKLYHYLMSWCVDVGADPVVGEYCHPDHNEICAELMGKMVATIIDMLQKHKLKIVNQ